MDNTHTAVTKTFHGKDNEKDARLYLATTPTRRHVQPALMLANFVQTVVVTAFVVVALTSLIIGPGAPATAISAVTLLAIGVVAGISYAIEGESL